MVLIACAQYHGGSTSRKRRVRYPRTYRTKRATPVDLPEILGVIFGPLGGAAALRWLWTRFGRWFAAAVKDAVRPSFEKLHRRIDDLDEANDQAHQDLSERVARLDGRLDGHIDTAGRSRGDDPD